jgi:hypothetical protein
MNWMELIQDAMASKDEHAQESLLHRIKVELGMDSSEYILLYNSMGRDGSRNSFNVDFLREERVL